MNENRRLSGIMFTDIVGFSKMMNKDENLTMSLLNKHDEMCTDFFSTYKGELIKKNPYTKKLQNL